MTINEYIEEIANDHYWDCEDLDCHICEAIANAAPDFITL